MNKKLALLLLSASFILGFTPKSGDLVELTSALNGNKKSDFNQNGELLILPPRTVGTILITKKLPSGNYGVCIQPKNSAELKAKISGPCVWVFYNMKQPEIKLYNYKNTTKQTHLVPTKNPTKAKAVETKVEVTAVKEPHPLETPPLKVNARPLFPQQNQREVFFNPVKTEKIAISYVSDAVAVNAAQVIENLNNNLSSIQPQAECRDCSKPLRAYEQCEDAPLEKEIMTLKDQDPFINYLLNKSDSSQIINRACIQGSMWSAPKKDAFYRLCEPQDQKATARIKPNCVSENYTKLIHQSFETVHSCMNNMLGKDSDSKENALALFSLFSLESGMHVNAQSSTGAGSFAQLTEGAIEQLNKSYIKKVRENLLNSPSSECQSIAASINTPMKGSLEKSCDRLAISKGNPLKSMIYSYAYQAYTKQGVERVILDEPYAEVFSKLSTKGKSRLLMAIANWANNTGIGGMTVPIQFLMKDRRLVPLKDSEIDAFLETLSKYMKTHPHKDNRSASRQIETPKFYKDIQTRLNTINKIVRSSGGQSCLNP